MSDKTLLKEVVTEKKAETTTEVEIKQEKQIQPEIKTETQKQDEKTINIFSAASFPAAEIERLKKNYEQEEAEINKLESKVSEVIEKPNYDTMETLTEVERKKIFVFNKSESGKKTKPNRFKVFVISVLFAFFGVWGVVNVATIDNISGQIAQVSSQYELNLANYLKNLWTLDATNADNMENLFETIPDSELPPTKVDEQSNWFDRFCNFLGGLFGG